MASIPVLRRRFTWAAGALGFIAVAAAGYSVLPIGPTPEDKWREANQVAQERKLKIAQTAPLMDISGKIGKAQKDIQQFYIDRLPSRYSNISADIGKLALQNGVQLSNVHYSQADADITDLQRLAIDANLTGDYSHAVKFINAVERSKLFLLIDNVSLAPEQQGGNVTLQVHMQTYLRGGAPQDAQAARENDPREPVVTKKKKSGA